MSKQFDAVILGGGPAGATAAALMAEAGLRVVVLEKETFPRFHIGESLLPATVRIFDRLGVHDAVRERFPLKPGGKWLYGDDEVPGDFSNSDRHASFKENPYSYLVERSTFDKILIDRAIDAGADVRFQNEVCDLVYDGERVAGVTARDAHGADHEFRGRIVVDCTGLRAFVGRKLGVRDGAAPQRMGIYAQYRARIQREDADGGWFVGQMFYDGWTWLLKLPDDRVSVGVVLTVDRFRKSGLSPEELLDYLISENDLLRENVVDPGIRESEVMVTGNMGNTCTQLTGDGWVMAGDSGFFIDPCYSSGVHIAMAAGEKVADIVAGQPVDQPVPRHVFDEYEAGLRTHERYVTKMVEAFYSATRSTSVRKMVTMFQGGEFTRQFVTFVGGDFSKNLQYISRVHFLSKVVEKLLPHRKTFRDDTHPDYLIARKPSFSEGKPVHSSTQSAASDDDALVAADVLS